MNCKSTDEPKSIPEAVPESSIPEPNIAPPTNNDQICQEVLCRQEVALEIYIDKENTYRYTYPQTPYYYNSELTILPGEFIYLELLIENDDIISATAVKKIKKKSTTLIFKFEQIHRADEDRYVMMLTVVNPLNYNLNYNAYMQKIDSLELVSEPVCVVVSKKNSYEIWKYPITQLILNELTLSSEAPETVQCP